MTDPRDAAVKALADYVASNRNCGDDPRALALALGGTSGDIKPRARACSEAHQGLHVPPSGPIPFMSPKHGYRWRKVARMLAALYAHMVRPDAVPDLTEDQWATLAAAAGVNPPSAQTRKQLVSLMTEFGAVPKTGLISPIPEGNHSS